MKTNRIYLPLIIAVSVAIGLLLGSKLNSSSSVYSGKNANKNKLNKLLDYIEREYVDAVNSDSIVDLTVTKILENLDPHSVYIDQKELVAVSESMQGDFVGIGVNFYLYNDTVAVIKPIKNGPSEKAGILAGDRILSANNYTLFGKQISNDTLFSKLKGEVGSLVHLEIYRKATNKKFKLNITRDRVPIKSVPDESILRRSEPLLKNLTLPASLFSKIKSLELILISAPSPDVVPVVELCNLILGVAELYNDNTVSEPTGAGVIPIPTWPL